MVYRLGLAWLAVVVAGCGTTDNRPLTVEYVTETILAPSCGAAQCHSTFSANRADIFDTVIGARSSLVGNGLILFDSQQNDPANPDNSQLLQWITKTDPYGLGIGRMPWDAPLPNEDVLLLATWIRKGAHGAQCDPGVGNACNNKEVWTCGSDWNFAALVMTCANGCNGGICQ